MTIVLSVYTDVVKQSNKSQEGVYFSDFIMSKGVLGMTAILMGRAGSVAASQLQDPCLDPELGLLCMFPTCSPVSYHANRRTG